MAIIKKYVAVHVTHYGDGSCFPTAMQVDGEAYLIESISEIQSVAAEHNLGAEERFIVRIHGKERPLFREGQRWFVIPGARIIRKGDHHPAA